MLQNYGLSHVHSLRSRIGLLRLLVRRWSSVSAYYYADRYPSRLLDLLGLLILLGVLRLLVVLGLLIVLRLFLNVLLTWFLNGARLAPSLLGLLGCLLIDRLRLRLLHILKCNTLL